MFILSNIIGFCCFYLCYDVFFYLKFIINIFFGFYMNIYFLLISLSILFFFNEIVLFIYFFEGSNILKFCLEVNNFNFL